MSTLVNVGSVANDGTGDPLRNAFQTINANFANIAGLGNIVSGVSSVAGRTGNVVLAVNDVAGAASVSYVNTQIANNPVLITTAPESSMGTAGDTKGMMFATGTDVYICYANYDGTNDIWAKVSTVGTTW